MTERRRALPSLDSAGERTGRKRCRQLASTGPPNLKSWTNDPEVTDIDWSDQDDDATTSEEEQAQPLRARQLQRRRARAVNLATVNPTLGGLTFLERSSVGPATEKKYQKIVEEFLLFADAAELRLVADAEVDAGVVRWMNTRFERGRPTTDGDFLMAGLLFFQPQYGKLGGQSLARSWRALKGWRRRVPSRSRRPLPRLVWSGVIWELFRRKQELMGMHVLMMIALYCRPGELLTVRRGDLIRPMRGVSLNWSVLLHPIERGVPSKTAVFDDTLEVENKIFPWLGQVVEALAGGPASEHIFPYTYVAFTKQFKRACAAIGLHKVVPYQCRHSGASIDRAQRHRTVAEIKKRGRWRSDLSIARYEKAGRLSQIQAELSHEQLVFLTATDTALEGLIFGTRFVGELQMKERSLSVSLPTSSAGRARSAWQ